MSTLAEKELEGLGQLRLPLAWAEPWDGLSPRVLTKGFIPLFSRQKPPRHEVYLDPDQLDLWPEAVSHTDIIPPRARPGEVLEVGLGGRHRRSRFRSKRR